MKKSHDSGVSPPRATAVASITSTDSPLTPIGGGFVESSQRLIPAEFPPRTAVGITPDVSSLNGEGYKDLAASLPSPSYLVGESCESTESPSVADAYTIPGSHVTAESLPFNRKGLPWRSWRSKYATIESLYVLAARHYASPGDRRAVHAVFSPSPDSIQSEADVSSLKEKAIRVAEEHGIRGGVTAFHGFRVDSSVSERFNELIAGSELAETATGVLLWEWIRQAEDVDVESFLTWGPHVHIVGLCRESADEIDSYRGDGVFRQLREFEPYTRDMPMKAIADHRSVGKDTIDHLTFHRDGGDAPMQWFGSLEGDSPVVAEQYATDYTINEIRERLINGPTNPEFYDVGVAMNVRWNTLIDETISRVSSRMQSDGSVSRRTVVRAASEATVAELTRNISGGGSESESSVPSKSHARERVSGTTVAAD